VQIRADWEPIVIRLPDGSTNSGQPDHWRDGNSNRFFVLAGQTTATEFYRRFGGTVGVPTDEVLLELANSNGFWDVPPYMLATELTTVNGIAGVRYRVDFAGGVATDGFYAAIPQQPKSGESVTVISVGMTTLTADPKWASDIDFVLSTVTASPELPQTYCVPETTPSSPARDWPVVPEGWIDTPDWSGNLTYYWNPEWLVVVKLDKTNDLGIANTFIIGNGVRIMQFQHESAFDRVRWLRGLGAWDSDTVITRAYTTASGVRGTLIGPSSVLVGDGVFPLVNGFVSFIIEDSLGDVGQYQFLVTPENSTAYGGDSTTGVLTRAAYEDFLRVLNSITITER
jgi:hypothetical protein